MRGFLAGLGAWLGAWWAGQFMDDPPAFEIEPEEKPEEKPEETIYHILPYPLPHNEEYYTYQLPDAGQDGEGKNWDG